MRIADRVCPLSRILLISSTAAGAVHGALSVWAGTADLAWSAVWTILLLIPSCVIGSWLAIQVARDYPPATTKRKAWLSIAASIAAMLSTLVINCASYLARLAGQPDHWVGFRQHGSLLSILFLFFALLLMWNAFARLGFGLSLRAADVGVITVIVAAAFSFLSFYRDMPDMNSADYLVPRLQYLNPLLIAAVAILGVLLLRVSMEIGEGQFARSLRYLVLMLLARLLVIALFIVPVARDSMLFSVVRYALSWSVPALFLVAVVARWSLIRSAATIAEDPEGAIPPEFAR